jgi:hypothetical protein
MSMLSEIASKHNLQLDIFLKNVSRVKTIGCYCEWAMALFGCVRTRVIALHREKLDVMYGYGNGVQESRCDTRRAWLLLKKMKIIQMHKEIEERRGRERTESESRRERGKEIKFYNMSKMIKPQTNSILN